MIWRKKGSKKEKGRKRKLLNNDKTKDGRTRTVGILVGQTLLRART